MRRWLFTAAILLAGCASSGNDAPPKPEFFLFDVPSSASGTRSQGMDMYAVVGHGRTCYIAGFGAAKVLLWCESPKDRP
jgi:hypothetical protein